MTLPPAHDVRHEDPHEGSPAPTGEQRVQALQPPVRRGDAAWVRAAPLVFVMNAGSGSNEAEATRETITREVERSGRVLHFVLIDAAADLPARAAEAAARARDLDGVLVAVGGDGTLNVIAGAALAADVPLGVIPQGTFNFFGRNLGIPTELEPALRVLLDPCMRSLRLGRVGPAQARAQAGEGVPRQLFLVSASLGFYPQIIEDREYWKQQLGRRRIVALWSGLMTLLGQHRTLRLTLRGSSGQAATVKTSTLLVSDNALQMANLGLPEAQAIEDGQLAGLVVRATSRWQLLGLALRGALKRLADDERLQRFTFERLEVAVRRPAPGFRFKVAVDGEIHEYASPLVFDVSPQPLQVLVPWPDAISAEARDAREAMGERAAAVPAGAATA
ncbi:MAG: diacylglycerol kinase family protein [Comamonas sp.]